MMIIILSNKHTYHFTGFFCTYYTDARFLNSFPQKFESRYIPTNYLFHQLEACCVTFTKSQELMCLHTTGQSLKFSAHTGMRNTKEDMTKSSHLGSGLNL